MRLNYVQAEGGSLTNVDVRVSSLTFQPPKARAGNDDDGDGGGGGPVVFGFSLFDSKNQMHSSNILTSDPRALMYKDG